MIKNGLKSQKPVSLDQLVGQADRGHTWLLIHVLNFHICPGGSAGQLLRLDFFADWLSELPGSSVLQKISPIYSNEMKQIDLQTFFNIALAQFHQLQRESQQFGFHGTFEVIDGNHWKLLLLQEI